MTTPTVALRPLATHAKPNVWGLGALSPDGKWFLSGYVSGKVVSSTLTAVGTRNRKATIHRVGDDWGQASKPMWLESSREWVQLAFGKGTLSAIVQGFKTQPHGFKIGNPSGLVDRFHLNQSQLIGETHDGRVLAMVNGANWPTNSDHGELFVYSFRLADDPDLRQNLLRFPPGLTNWECHISPDGKSLGWLLVEKGSDTPKAFLGTNPVEAEEVKLISELRDWDEEASSPIFRRFDWREDSASIALTDRTRRWVTRVP